MKRKIITGHAVHIEVIGAALCGGVAAKTRKLLRGVSFRNIFVRMTNRKATRRKLKAFTKRGALFAKK
jgi:hypothetical protein